MKISRAASLTPDPRVVTFPARRFVGAFAVRITTFVYFAHMTPGQYSAPPAGALLMRVVVYD